MTSARTQRGEPGIGLQYLSVCTHLPKAGRSPTRKAAPGECENCTSSTNGRGTDRERCKESASVIGGTGRRSATSAQPRNRREPGFYWRSSETPGTSPAWSALGECENCTFSTTGRGTYRERCKKSASVIGGTGQRSATSAQPGNRREPRFYWRSSETPGHVNASTAFFI